MVICTNCGFQNQPGDEFCGNCGRYLEFSGTASGGQQGADGTASGGGSTDGGGPDAPTVVGGVPVMGGGAAAGGAAGAGGAMGAGGAAGAGAVGGGAVGSGPAFRGGAPDVICWNCGRRNPPGRAFCMQCGTKITTDSGAAAGAGAGAVGAGSGAAGAGYGAGYGAGGAAGAGGGDGGGGGGGMRIAAILVGALAVLVLLGLGAVGLGLFNAPRGGTGIAVISPSPSASAGASGLASASPSSSALTSPGASLSSFDVATLVPPSGGVVVTLPPPTEAPTPGRTRRPPCDPLGQPPGCRPTRPPATPTMEPTPTAQPTPVDCSVATGEPGPLISLTPEAPTRQIAARYAWCIRSVTFTNSSNPGATGTLKLYLENPEFSGPPGNYGMAKIGWPGEGGACEASIDFNFQGGATTYSPTCTYPEGYMSLPPNTILSFEIVGCGTNGTCNGYATISFERIVAPLPPQP